MSSNPYKDWFDKDPDGFWDCWGTAFLETHKQTLREMACQHDFSGSTQLCDSHGNQLNVYEPTCFHCGLQERNLENGEKYKRIMEKGEGNAS